MPSACKLNLAGPSLADVFEGVAKRVDAIRDKDATANKLVAVLDRQVINASALRGGSHGLHRSASKRVSCCNGQS